MLTETRTDPALECIAVSATSLTAFRSLRSPFLLARRFPTTRNFLSVIRRCAKIRLTSPGKISASRMGYDAEFESLRHTSCRSLYIMMRATAEDGPFECILNAWGEHESELRGYLSRRLTDRHLADDLLQEVFIKALRQGQAFCSLENPRAWLFQVARNTLVDQQRRGKGSVRLPAELMSESEELRPVDALSECLERVLSELSVDDREILRRCDIEGVKQQDFATTHGLTLPAVKSRILRARQRLREFMVSKCQVRFDEGGKVCCHVPRGPVR